MSFSRAKLVALVAAGTFVTCSIGSIGCDSGAPYVPPLDPPPSSTTPSTSEESDAVTVDQIAINQGVKITLVHEGAVVKAANAPVIAGRSGRIHVRAMAPTPLTLTAELRLHSPTSDDVVLTDGPRTIVVKKPTPQANAFAEPDEDAFGATFEFEVAADHINHGSSISVILRDPNIKNADPVRARFPANLGSASAGVSLDVASHAPKLKVMLVPIRYRADGSNRLPALDQATLTGYRANLYKLYPVSDVELALHPPLDWTLEAKPNGDGWHALLHAVMMTRRDEQPPDDVYYVGIFNPAETQAEYCKGGCVQGMASAMIDFFGAAVDRRAALVAGFDIVHTALAQEIAHAMGRFHAPCGSPKGIDGKFPYDDGTIGKPGWDIVEKKPIDAERYDFMSYCSPVWVSDYTFRALHKHMSEIEVSMSQREPPHAARVPAVLLSP